LIHLAIYYETMLAMHPQAKYMFTEHVEKEAPKRLKGTWRSELKKVVWATPEFADVEEECEDDEDDEDDDNDGKTKTKILKVGTHSRRKFAADYAANCGHDENEIEIRARWKQKRGGKQVFIYISFKKAYEDAIVCATLCIGGPVMYRLKEGSAGDTITPEWLFEKVIPNIRRRFPHDTRLCTILGTVLLYACMSDEEDIFMPNDLRERVRAEYNLLNLDEASGDGQLSYAGGSDSASRVEPQPKIAARYLERVQGGFEW
jgi:hypothetical protein